MNQQVTIKAGYLRKLTVASGPASLMRRPTRRWFVFLLFGGLPSLEYYEDAAAATTDPPVNSFDLRGCSRVTRSPEPCSFLLTLADRQLTLTADSEADAEDWADTLDRNLAHLAARRKPENIYGTFGDGGSLDDGDGEGDDHKASGCNGAAATATEPIGDDLVDEDDIQGMKEMERQLEQRRGDDEVTDELRRLEGRVRQARGEDAVRDLRQELRSVDGGGVDGDDENAYEPYGEAADPASSAASAATFAGELDSMGAAAYAVLERKYHELEDWDALTRLRTRRYRSAHSVFQPNPDPPPYQHLTKPALVSGFFDRKADISVEETEGGRFVVNTLGPGGPRLSPLCAAVERLKRQILHPGGVQLHCRAPDLLNHVAIVQCAGRLWIAGWSRAATRLHGCLHVGDQLAGLDGFRLESLEQARRILHGAVDRVALRLRRLPHGKAFCVRRPDGRSLGLVTAGHKAEVAHVQQDGAAAAHGLAYRTPGVIDDANFTTWTLTEVNGRPLSLWPEPKEVAMRLAANGPEMSLVVQPTDLVRAMRAQLKKLPGYRQLVLH